MINEIEIKNTVEEFLQKMTIADFSMELKVSSIDKKDGDIEGDYFSQDIIDLDIELKEPQILIGSNGQTLFELQHILRIILNKKFKKIFYLKLDINNYKEKKIEYIKNLAKDIADEVFLTKEKKILPPMPAYQRRIIHMELAQRQDIITESQGDGENRYIIVNAR